MLTVWKYELGLTELDVIAMPKNARILHVREQDETACIWALVDPQETELEARSFCVYGTGHRIPNRLGEYIGTVHLMAGSLVFHVFEIK